MPRASTLHARGSCEKNQLGSGVRWNCGFPNVMISSALYVFHAHGKLISHDLFMAPLPLGTSVPRPKFHQVPGTSLGDTRYGTLVQRYWYLHVRCQRCLGTVKKINHAGSLIFDHKFPRSWRTQLHARKNRTPFQMEAPFFFLPPAEFWLTSK